MKHYPEPLPERHAAGRLPHVCGVCVACTSACVSVFTCAGVCGRQHLLGPWCPSTRHFLGAGGKGMAPLPLWWAVQGRRQGQTHGFKVRVKCSRAGQQPGLGTECRCRWWAPLGGLPQYCEVWVHGQVSACSSLGNSSWCAQLGSDFHTVVAKCVTFNAALHPQVPFPGFYRTGPLLSTVWAPPSAHLGPGTYLGPSQQEPPVPCDECGSPGSCTRSTLLWLPLVGVAEGREHRPSVLSLAASTRI